MVEPLESSSFNIYCRYAHSKINGKAWGEIFAINITPGMKESVIESAKIISRAFSEGNLHRDNIWEVAKLASGIPFESLKEHPMLPCYVEINDFTEDIDFETDVELIKKSLPIDLETALDKLSELHEVINTNQIHYEFLRSEHESLASHVSELRNKLSLLETSLSWRLTTPLRVFKDKFLGPFTRIFINFRFEVKDKFSLKKFTLEAWRYILARLSGITHKEWISALPSEVFSHLPKHQKAIHIGGHLGREYDAYEDVLFIEPIPKYAKYLRLLRRKVIEASCCGDLLYITKYEQASSNLIPLEHEVKSTISTLNMKLDEINDGSFDLLVIDAQGSELKILKSGELLFHSIIVEGSIIPRYKGAASKKEITEFLESKNYTFVSEFQHGNDDVFDMIFTLKV